MTRAATLLTIALAVLVARGADAPLRLPEAERTEVVVLLASPALAHDPLARDRVAAEQRAFRARLEARIPAADVRWRYRLVLNGFAVTVPRDRVETLRRIPGVRDVLASGTYEPQLDRSPGQIGAPSVWGPNLGTAGQGMKIGILDTGVDPGHPFFDPTGYAMPDGFPRGQSQFTSAKVIVARAFAPPGSRVPGANLAFDGDASSHGTHVAGIAAGNAQTPVGDDRVVSGVAPRAYIGNYKVFTRSGSDGGPIENAGGLVAAIEAAVRDGMDVINLSLGEPEINPRRNVVTLALDGAAAAGVVPVVAAGNEYNDVGAGSVSSPATAKRAIAVAAVATNPPVHADFSSVGPTPISNLLKPDVSAPGVGILSSLPGGGWSSASGTSMAAPHVAGAAALLRQRHPSWTVDELRSALVQSGTDVSDGSDGALGPQFQGGGLIALARADQPLFFAQPSSLSFGLIQGGGSTVERRVALRDAGGGASAWNVTVEYVQRPTGSSATLAGPAEVRILGELVLAIRLGASPQAGDVSGFVLLRRASAVRRIPFWGRVTVPRLVRHRAIALRRPGLLNGTTRGSRALVSRYRYPENPSGIGVTTVLAGPETVYRVNVRRRIANFGVVVTTRAPGVRVEPRVVATQDENRLTGIAALPVARNPYLEDAFYRPVLAAGALSPARGIYSVVFDSPTTRTAGGFRFRFWVNDVTPPTLRFPTRSVQPGESLLVTALDAGSGVSPDHVFARVDGRAVRAPFRGGVIRISTAGLAPGTHRLRLQVSDVQETKNTENVVGILPNTRLLTTTFRVQGP
jgi:subtilisin family serine protease